MRALAISPSVVARRRLSSLVWVALCGGCAAGVAVILLLIMGYIVHEGISALSLSFLTRLPRPTGITGGGVANGIVGSLIVIAIAAIMAFPVGIFVGIYLAVYSHLRLAQSLSFVADVLAGVPSIAIGIYAYTVLVQPFRHFSALSASFAFAVLMVPLVIRATEGAIALVPRELREAATALGAPEFRVTFKILLVSARSGIITGLILSLARVTGETAPLLFTAFGSQFWEFDPTQPMAELPLQIFTYAISPYNDWHAQAWGGALILVLAVLLLSVLARLSTLLGTDANARSAGG
ncbi:MAG TPA: phosphate ABC transporter permease PstA [Stellaceae bacterium]|nr:phosphate ABC transporter permease PstA [Stellaceae bacterium]